MFTKENSIHEILGHQKLKQGILTFFPAELLEFVPEEFKDCPISQVEQNVNMPWGLPFMGDEFIFAANKTEEVLKEKTISFISIWDENSSEVFPKNTGKEKSDVRLLCMGIPSKEKKPIALICPGGAYRLVSVIKEGIQAAKKMEEAGYFPFILLYRTAPYNHFPAPQDDLTQAIRHIRENADKYNVDADNLLAIGFSAGGHLVASTSALNKDPQLRPNKVCLSYPVISFLSEYHEESFQNISGGMESLRKALSVEQIADENFPKTFVWTCADDIAVPPSNSVRLADVLKRHGVECELQIYPTGGHGCGLGTGTSAEGWMDSMLKFMEQHA